MAKSGASHTSSLAEANKRPGKSARPKASSLEFSAANGGLVSRARGGDDGLSGDSSGQTIHPSMSHAVAHLKSTLAHVYEDKDA